MLDRVLNTPYLAFTTTVLDNLIKIRSQKTFKQMSNCLIPKVTEKARVFYTWLRSIVQFSSKQSISDGVSEEFLINKSKLSFIIGF